MLGAQPVTVFERLDGEDAGDLPPALQHSLSRHRDNLASMVTALRAAGLDEDSIQSHLSVLIDSYRSELAAALRHLGRES